MDAAALGGLDRFAGAVDVLLAGAREAGDDGALGTARDFLHGGEIAVRRNGETGLDDVDAHFVEQLGHLELLVEGHGGAGALLAVAQGGVEDDDAVLVGLVSARSWEIPSSRMRPVAGAHKGFADQSPP